MLKKIVVALVVLGLTLTGLTACASSTRSGSSDEYYGVCVDPNTEVRLPDSECADAELDSYEDYQEDDNDGLSLGTVAVLWFLLANNGRSYPAVGAPVSRSSVKTSLPKGAKYRGTGLTSSGGTLKGIKTKKTTSSNKKKSSGFGGSKSRSSGGKRR